MLSGGWNRITPLQCCNKWLWWTGKRILCWLLSPCACVNIESKRLRALIIYQNFPAGSPSPRMQHISVAELRADSGQADLALQGWKVWPWATVSVQKTRCVRYVCMPVDPAGQFWQMVRESTLSFRLPLRRLLSFPFGLRHFAKRRWQPQARR